MTSSLTFVAGLALIRDEFILLLLAICTGPIMDQFAATMGNFQINDPIFYVIQPAFAWYYGLILLAGIMRVGWFYLITIRRVDYYAEF